MPLPPKVLLIARITITICIIIAAPLTESPSSNIYATMLILLAMLILKVFGGLFPRISATQLNTYFICGFPRHSRVKNTTAVSKILLAGR